MCFVHLRMAVLFLSVKMFLFIGKILSEYFLNGGELMVNVAILLKFQRNFN